MKVAIRPNIFCRYILALLLITCSLFNIVGQSPPNNMDNSLIHKIYLVGDAGGLDNYSTLENIVFEQIKKNLEKDSIKADLVFLGDNLYPAGLHEKGTKERKKEEQIIDAHIALASANKGKSYIIPGNHDWNDNRAGGAMVNRLQYDYVKKKSKGINLKYLPKKSCGDPEVVKVNKDLVYIFIDSQWWLHDWTKESQINKGCKIKSRLEFVEEMERVIADHKNDHIVFFLHHPFRSDGNHGAKFSLKTHLFPIPILGSLMPLARKMGITKQDNTSKSQQQLHTALTEAITLAGANSTFFVSGHDHNLQYFHEAPLLSKSKRHYIISGSGYKQGFVSKQGSASFSSGERGYQVLEFYKDGSITLSINAVNKKTQLSHTVFQKEIVSADINKISNDINTKEYPILKNTISTAPNKDLDAGSFYRIFFGSQYRKFWSKEIEVPVMNLSSHLGGLKPTKLGGGLSSNSLRVQDSIGREYILRSVKKDFRKLIPEENKKLVWIDYYADQNASAIPYGALMLKQMSDAVGVFHTDPSLYYLPHQSGLLQFNEKLTEGLYIFEKRPDGKLWSDKTHFGNSKKIIGTPDVIEKLADKKTHKVDQSWVLKSRLFDMIIHDWDRHEDQWRWASYKDESGTTYRPIPRDRDWAFYKSKGMLYAVMNGIYIKKFKTFKKELKDVQNFNLSAKHFDRFFLNELDWEDWEKEINHLQEKLSDEVILSSLEDLPTESRVDVKDEVVPKLKHRVKTLHEYAEKYYRLLSKELNISGSYDKDFFELTEHSSNQIKVLHYIIKKDVGKIIKFERIISTDLTKEIYLFGRSNDDELILNGNIESVKLFFVGGSGDDKITSYIKQNNLTIYDEPEGIIYDNQHIKNGILTDDIELNNYNYRHFRYDELIPTLSIGSTFDEGLWFGLGLTKTNFGFKQLPYKNRHQLNLSIAPFTRNAFRVDYAGSYNISRRNNWFLDPSIYYHNPDYINFFGLENELSPVSNNRGFNWVKFKKYGADLKFSNKLLSRFEDKTHIHFSIGPSYQSINLGQREDRVAAVYNLPSETLDQWNQFIGADALLSMQSIDNQLYPKNGFKLFLNTAYTQQFSSGDTDFTHIKADLSLYLTPIESFSLILATKASYQQTFGDPLWYQQPSAGVNNNLRPFRNDRFRGTRLIVQQTELRKELFTWNNRIFPFTLGVNAGIDYAYIRNNASANKLYHGYVAGLSFNVLDLFLLNTNITQSEEEVLFNLSTGMSF